MFEFKNETARLKEAAFNRGNKVTQENYAKEKLSNFFLQRENAFVKTELNNKQHIIEKLLNINSNQPKDNGLKIKDTQVNELLLLLLLLLLFLPLTKTFYIALDKAN